MNESMVDKLYHSVLAYPTAIACRMGKRTWTYAELWQDIEETAANLNASFPKGTKHVALVLPNTYQALVYLYAINYLGLVIVMIHPMSSAHNLLKRLTQADCDVWITMDILYQRYTNLSIPIPCIILPLTDSLSGYKKILMGFKVKPIKSETILTINKVSQSSLQNIRKLNPFALILFSSGSSSIHKAICLSNSNLNSLVDQMKECINPIPTQESMLSILPFFHGFGLGVGLHTPLCLGGTAILIPRFSSQNFIKAILRYKPTYIIGVPQLYLQLFKTKAFTNQNLAFLKQAFVGGETIDPSLVKTFNEIASRNHSLAKLQIGYGLTETVTACSVTDLNESIPNTIGKALKGVTIRIYDQAHNCFCETHELGEILVSGPTTMMGYYKDIEATKIALQEHDGKIYVHTQDIGSIDELGNLSFAYRQSEIIKINGYLVNLHEIENVISHNFNIDEVKVVAYDQSIGVICSLKNEKLIKQTKKELTELMHTHIDHWSLPDKIVIVKQIYKNETGKLDTQIITQCFIEQQFPLSLLEWYL